jgi:hypothetical protein
MTLRTIDLDQVRVVQADNYKGNSRVYLEIMDARVLYTEPGNLPEHYLNDDGSVDTEALAELFRVRLAAIFARLLLDDSPSMFRSMGWDIDTDREIGYVKPRLDEDRYA